MFRTVPLPTIRSYFTVHTTTVYVIQVCWQLASRIRTLSTNFSNLFLQIKFYMFRTVPLSITRSFFTVHTAMVYVIQVCWQFASRIRTLSINFSNLFLQIKFYMFRTVPLSIIRSFFTVHTAMVYVIQVCWHLVSRIRTADDGQRNCPKRVEFYLQK